LDISDRLVDLRAIIAEKYPLDILNNTLDLYYQNLNSLQTISKFGWSPSISPVIAELKSNILVLGRIKFILEQDFERHFETAFKTIQSFIDTALFLESNLPLPDPIFYEL
jgi:hypothetical protein